MQRFPLPRFDQSWELMAFCFSEPNMGKKYARFVINEFNIAFYFPKMLTLRAARAVRAVQTRKERFMGWYHSHPFDVEVHTHCFLSSTDISTQLSWQRAEDPHGNPWLAIVVRSYFQQSPKRSLGIQAM